MDRNIPSGTGTKHYLADMAAAFSGESPAFKTPMFVGANSVETSHDVTCVSSGFAIEDVLPDSRAQKPSTRPLEVGMSTSLEVLGGGAADSADSLGDLARDARIHLLCALPCLLAEAGYPKQQHLEATLAVRPAVFSATGSLLVCCGAAPIPPGAHGVASGESIPAEELTAPTLLPSWPAARAPTSGTGCLCSLGV
ncbi:hypothetical protein HPB52_021016 [Rhipicephalus sanguineus]|uniref:Uncharacterized protein n=1 Tax=Rhipicephalus sanguineus TaxID=34632 RepID=A0A9D4TBL0_RHISA|nr:hypothetical protein HPB52_021016 [Rhipicephalus sanguineus]